MYLDRFLRAAAKSCKLRDLEIGGSLALNATVLKSLFDIQSIHRLHLSKLDPSMGLFEVLTPLARLQNLKTLRLRHLFIKVHFLCFVLFMRVDKSKKKDGMDVRVIPGAFPKLETLQLWDLYLNDAQFLSLLPHFAHIRTLSLRGQTNIKPPS